MSAPYDGYSSPYGDLHDSRPQHSTFSYDDSGERAGDDESRVLIRAARSSDESDLAMAVVDILSCCDSKVNTNQAKLLRDMENRFHENGHLVGNDDKQEQFIDEESVFQKFSPIRWFRTAAQKKDKYIARSSQFIIELPSLPAEKPPKKSKLWKRGLVVGAVGVVLVFAVVVWLTKLGGISFPSGNKSQASQTTKGESPFTHDCTIVDSQSNPSPLSQCACDGEIAKISDQAREKYETLLFAFGAEYLHPNETISSCSSRNQALMWLAEDAGSTLSNVLIQRHTLVRAGCSVCPM